MKKKIAITGGIGSGKSLVCNFLMQMGEVCLSCDEISKELWRDTEYCKELAGLFPRACVEGEIKRELLSELIFSEKSELEKLNAFSHPRIMKKLQFEMEQYQGERIFAEVPLLFEGGLEKEFDFVIVVLRERFQRAQSVIERDGCTSLQAEKRINAQFNYDSPNLWKNSKYLLLENNHSVDILKKNLMQILLKL